MWFASKHRGLLRLLRAPSTAYAPNGDVIETKAKLFFQFTPGQFPDWALPTLKQIWPDSPGVPDNLINPKLAYGGVESRVVQKQLGWSDEDRMEAERIMIENPDGEVIALEEPEVNAPWPDYDRTAGGPKRGFPGKTTPQAIVAMIGLTGSDPEQVLLYERQRFGNERPEVILALERAAADKASTLIPA